jgi:dienelactone hydrolase
LKPCEAYRQEALSRGANFQMFVYPGIDHDWDMPFPVRFDTTQRGLNENCLLQSDLKEQAVRLGDGTKVAYSNPELRGIVSKYMQSCPTNGIHEGSDSKTKADAIARITAFIKKSFDAAS